MIDFPTDDGCRWSVLVRDIDSEQVLLQHCPERVLSTASIGKLFLLHRILHEVDAGTRSLDELVTRLPSDVIGGSGLWQKLQQDALSIYDLAALVGAVSDNDATNALLRVVGIDAVREHARELGYQHSRLNDAIRWPIPPGHPSRLSEANAGEMVDFVSRLQLDRDLSPSSGDIFRKWLGAGADMSMVASVFDFDGLDHDCFDGGVWLWNKTGTISTVRADVGVVMGRRRRVAYAVLAEWVAGADARGTVLETMAEVGLLIGEAVGWQDPRPKRSAARAAAVPAVRPAPVADARAAIAVAANDAALRDVRYLVLDGDSGAPLLERSPDEPSPSASVMKTVTGTLALANLGADHRIPTRVVRISDSEAVLIGGGDVTLSRTPTDEPTFYPHPAHLDALADQLRTNMPGLERLLLDDGLFAASQWHPTWDPAGRSPENYIPFISALQVDGDRDDPLMDDSARSENPVGRVAAALGALLGDVEIARGSAPEGVADEVARAESAPVTELVREVLRSSDNALAEALARLVALARGGDASWSSIQREIRAAVADLGLDASGCEFVDGSGLSEDNRLTPRFVAELLRRGYLGEEPFASMVSRLTVSGQTMAPTRFTGANRVVGNSVRAKTGFINSVHSLAGIVTTRGRRNLVFAVFACDLDTPVDREARLAVERLVTALHLHGDALG
ncbi:D-alanyl-D-alanine carboxypeptidase [uncultured Gulosibacter sp.]|uniref:D-alanyl-D-alanine carboxypeptidase n=1 Tax=uncultured Gulosibacter sp. TaxID=1339167 RepID=UPI00288A3FF4|nr:D-alanyl-D-alanine carboxypeptidase [uncultured Gulosibacter sp.]